MVDLLLDSSRRHQSVDGHVPVLSNPPGPLPGLSVCRGVPVGVKDEDSVGPGEIHSEASNLGGEYEDKVVPAIELRDQFLPGSNRRPPVQPEVLVVLLLHVGLNDRQHHLRLTEEEHSVTLFPPQLEQRVYHHHLPTPLVETELVFPIPLSILHLPLSVLWTSREEVWMVADLPQGNETHEHLQLAI